MKLLFNSPQHSKVLTLDVDKNISAEAMKEILITQYGLPKGSYKFLLKGKILRPSAPFIDVKENSQIFIYIKGNASSESSTSSTQSPNPIPGIQTTSAPAPAAPTRSSASSASSTSSTSASASTQASTSPSTQASATTTTSAVPPQQIPATNRPVNPTPGLNNPSRPPQPGMRQPASRQPSPEQNQLFEQIVGLFRDLLFLLPLEEVYNAENDYFNHPAELGRVLHAIEGNQHAATLLMHEISTTTNVNNFGPPHFVNNLLGIDPITHIITETQAIINELPKNQREDIKRLEREGYNSADVLKALQNSNFDVNLARSALAAERSARESSQNK